MLTEFALLAAYRLMALAVAILMVVVLFRARDYRTWFYAMIVFVPFALRAAGLK